MTVGQPATTPRNSHTAANLVLQAIEVFLEAAGVPKDYIDFFRSRIGRPIQFYSTFISYSTKDQDFADRKRPSSNSTPVGMS